MTGIPGITLPLSSVIIFTPYKIIETAPPKPGMT
jgi:hypothetical protein